MWERVFLIPFELSFVDDPEFPFQRKRDPHLKEKLLKEKSGILAWLLRGYHEYQREGLNPPEIVFQQVDEYKKHEDTIHGFIQECCEIKEDGIANSTQLFKAYRDYCKNNDLKQESHTKFGIVISKRFKKGRIQGRIYYKGIFLQIKY
jgi:putative DNA primase/helicase